MNSDIKDNKIGKVTQNESLVNQVEKKLFEVLTSDNYQEGDKIPSENSLTETLGVSRSVVREALKILEAKGILTSHQGKGRYLTNPLIANHDITNLIEFESLSLNDFYELRLLLEPFLAAQAASRRSIKHIEAIENSIKKFKENINNTEGDYDFHIAVARASDNVLGIKIVEIFFNIQKIYSQIHYENLKKKYPAECWIIDQENILKSITSMDSKSAHTHMKEHIKKSYNAKENYTI